MTTRGSENSLVRHRSGPEGARYDRPRLYYIVPTTIITGLTAILTTTTTATSVTVASATTVIRPLCRTKHCQDSQIS
jgi:hypothetical protein